jgi:hypothetical protein
MLVLIAILHQVYGTLMEKIDRWPLRYLYLRCIELFGRVFVFPAVVIYFASDIPLFLTPSLPYILLSIVLIIAITIFIRECFGLRAAWDMSINALFMKCNTPEITVGEISWVEAFVLNRISFGKWSISKVFISEYLHRYGEFPLKKRRPLHLRNLASLMSLLDSQQSDIEESEAQTTTTTKNMTTKMKKKQHQQRSSSSLPRLRLSRIFRTAQQELAFTEDDFQQYMGQSSSSSSIPSIPSNSCPTAIEEDTVVEMTNFSSTVSEKNKKQKKNKQNYVVNDDDVIINPLPSSSVANNSNKNKSQQTLTSVLKPQHQSNNQRTIQQQGDSDDES